MASNFEKHFARQVRFAPVPTTATDLDRLLDEYRALADSSRHRGNYLEALARHYLLTEPQWADQLDEVWFWKDWPGRAGLPDTGVDLVASLRTGGLLAVQVKFFAQHHRMQKADLDSFFEMLGREPFTEGLVIDSTEGDWSSNALEALKNRSKPVRTVSLGQLRHSAIDWSSYDLLTPQNKPRRHESKQLREHQVTAIREVMTGFADDTIDRGKLVMACGTGKTFTALKLAERWTRERCAHRSSILFMVPSLALLQQTLEEWTRESDPELPIRAFAVGSDQQLGRTRTSDLTSVRLDELGAPATTDGNKLAAYLMADGIDGDGMTVVFATYHSISAIHQAQQITGEDFDLIICDEAHRTTGVTLSGENESHFVRIHDDSYVSGLKRVYMTATPRIFNDKVKNTARERDAELVSMDDESLYGPVLYRIGFGEAVERGLLTDYKVLVLGVSEDQITSSFQQDLASDGHELRISEVAKLIGCWNGLAKRQSGELAGGFGDDRAPMRRAVAFARDIKTSKGIANDFPHLVQTHLQNLLNEDPTDDLGVRARHVDGTMGTTERGALLDWLREDPGTDERGAPEARILTNARCLSEGIDVPSLDAVLFLNARKSQVDVVQAVGRVMRRSPGKRCGYIILPIAIPDGVSAETALSDNERYRVVWQVLQALRSHDERLDAKINQMAVTGRAPETILVEHVDLTPQKNRQDPGLGIGDADRGSAREEFDGADPDSNDDGSGARSGAQASLIPSGSTISAPLFGAEDWKDSVYAKLVKNVGDRIYWDDWAGDIAEIAQRFISLITAHLDAPENDRAPFAGFVTALRATVNPEISEAEAVELLAQHLITGPVFEAMFPEGSFTQDNPVSTAMEHVLETFQENAAFTREREPLDAFYGRVTERIRGLETVRAKQQMLVTLYDKFFTGAFPLLADRMGIVFTPVEVVDYILRSADAALHQHFGTRLSDEGVTILEPFVGTGTFLTRLMQTGLIRPEDLTRKYRRELFANEIVLLSYYVAAINVESVYRELCAEHGIEPATGGFAGISLTDTFAMGERDSQLAGGVFPENTARLEQQQATPIDVIVMNPPYRAGQSSANDGAQNAKYPKTDARIAETYVKRSSGSRKADLYDSYYRALRWATDRLGDQGVIAFVSNSGFVDGGTADGVRLSWVDEFSDVIVYNLRGNQRVKNWQAEGGKIFGEGSQTGIAITVLVKDTARSGPARVHYADIGDYLSREEKLDRLVSERSIEHTEFALVEPNDVGDWINQRDHRFGSWQSIGDKSHKGSPASTAVFRDFALGASTNRDAWVYSFSRHALSGNVAIMVQEFSGLVDDPTRVPDPRRIGWSSSFDSRRRRHGTLSAEDGILSDVIYRPFFRQLQWRDTAMIDRPGSLKWWPTAAHTNLAIAINAKGEGVPFITELTPDLHVNGDAQVFPRHTWEPVESADGGFNLDALDSGDPAAEDVVVDGYRRIDNVTDATLAAYRATHGDTVTKDDIFYGVYALLHHPTYRETYAADLKKMLPRIPQVKGFSDYARIGRALADLHLGYEAASQHPLDMQLSLTAPEDEFERYRIDKLSWGSRKDHTTIRYNAHLTIAGIPEAERLYTVGGRSPLEWVIDRYKVTIDGKSGIVNDPNVWLREQNNPRYVVDLIGSLVTVSLETQRLIAELPPFEVIE